MHGGVSHVDTWDPKPALTRFGPDSAGGFREGSEDQPHRFHEALVAGAALEVSAPRRESGTEISELFPHMAQACGSTMLFVRSCYGDAFDHAPAMYLRTTGSQFPGRPCLGAWSVYGLGSENQNLPAFVVMSDGAMKSGPQAYGAGFFRRFIRARCFAVGSIRCSIWRRRRVSATETQRATLDFISEQDRAPSGKPSVAIQTSRRGSHLTNSLTGCKLRRRKPSIFRVGV